MRIGAKQEGRSRREGRDRGRPREVGGNEDRAPRRSGHRENSAEAGAVSRKRTRHGPFGEAHTPRDKMSEGRVVPRESRREKRSSGREDSRSDSRARRGSRQARRGELDSRREGPKRRQSKGRRGESKSSSSSRARSRSVFRETRSSPAILKQRLSEYAEQKQGRLAKNAFELWGEWLQ